jgi:hypothetical protein
MDKERILKAREVRVSLPTGSLASRERKIGAIMTYHTDSNLWSSQLHVVHLRNLSAY